MSEHAKTEELKAQYPDAATRLRELCVRYAERGFKPILNAEFLLAALADAEAAGKLAGLEQIEEMVAVRLGHIKRVLLPGPFKDGEIDSLETLLSEICALMEN